MAREPNPFRPGFNRPPVVLAGRDEILAAAQEALDTVVLDGLTPRPLVLVGSRGVGKSVLLGEIAALAGTAYGWPTLAVEVQAGRRLVAQMRDGMTQVQELFESAPKGRRIRFEQARIHAQAAGVGAEATFGPGGRSSAKGPDRLERLLGRTMDMAADKGSGVVIAVDEIQLAGRSQVAEVAAAIQEGVPRGWPMLVLLAGLPSMRDPRRSVTYLERAEWHELGLLGPADTLRALVEPAAASGRPLSPAAASLLAERSGGHPFAIQVYGHHAWRASTGRPQITLGHARKASEAADRDLQSSLFAARWNDSPGREREYLTALALLVASGDEPTGGRVANALDASTTEVSYLRDRLLKKGTIIAEGHRLRFAVPGMADHVLRQQQE